MANLRVAGIPARDGGCVKTRLRNRFYDFVKEYAEKDDAAGQTGIFKIFDLDNVKKWLDDNLEAADLNLGATNLKTELEKLVNKALDPENIKDLAIDAAMKAAVSTLPPLITKKVATLFAPGGLGPGLRS